MAKRVFVFGSNEAGIHGKGAALVAYKQHGARYGKSYGHYGDSFAIPTRNENLEPIHIARLRYYVVGFIAYAQGHRKLAFQVTRINADVVGFKDADVAVMFERAPPNCLFDEKWRPFLGDEREYWGTF